MYDRSMVDPTERARRVATVLELAAARLRAEPARYVDELGSPGHGLGELFTGAAGVGDVTDALLVLMMAAARAADDDLRAQLERLERERGRKSGLRDRLGELSEADALHLQTVMDRRAKLLSTLSNLLKKMSDTAQTITQNLK